MKILKLQNYGIPRNIWQTSSLEIGYVLVINNKNFTKTQAPSQLSFRLLKISSFHQICFFFNLKKISSG